MKLNLFHSLTILMAFTSCHGPSASPAPHRKGEENIIDLTKVETVEELGKNIMLVYQDRKNNYWFGSWEDGLYKYDGQSILHFTTENGLPDNRIEEIKEDQSGNMYFNTSRGIIRSDGEKFHLLEVADSGNGWNLESKDLWFKDGWNSGYVFRYDGNVLYKLQLPKTKLGEDYILSNPTHPNPYTVYSIYKDSKGNIWFGTGGLGALRYNGKSFDWILERDVLEILNEPTEGANGVRSIIEDREGYFWFNSMFRYRVYDDKQLASNNMDSTFYSREKSIGSLDGQGDGKIYEYLSIVKDDNDDLWIATYDTGVYHYDGRNIKHHPVKDDTRQINLFTIYKDYAGQLWLGTQEAGAYKFNGQTFEKFRL